MKTRITLFFEPLDVLQFRDHRPFDMGDHVVARTVFPRPPTFRGALRTLLFPLFGARFDDADEHFGIPEEHAWARQWLGGRTQDGTVAMRGPLLAEWTGSGEDGIHPLLHCPHDLVRLEAGNVDGILRPAAGPTGGEIARLRWSAGTVHEVTGDLPWIGLDVGKSRGAPPYLTVAGAREYFAAAGAAAELFPPTKAGSRNTDAPPLVVEAKSVIQREPRVGIARNAESLAAEDSMFYVTSPYRLVAGYGFAIDVALPKDEPGRAREALSKLDGAVVALGGKGHRARVRIATRSLLGAAEDLAPGTAAGPCTVWLQTPLPLTGPLPQGTLVVADRPVPIGGFDFARGAPRALRPALPAGTILHLPEGAAWALPPALDPSGYGLSLVGPRHSSVSSPKGESR